MIVDYATKLVRNKEYGKWAAHTNMRHPYDIDPYRDCYVPPGTEYTISWTEYSYNYEIDPYGDCYVPPGITRVTVLPAENIEYRYEASFTYPHITGEMMYNILNEVLFIAPCPVPWSRLERTYQQKYRNLAEAIRKQCLAG